MSKMNAPILALNGGEVSKDALVRVDLEKMRLCLETAENIMLTVLGPTIFRAGTKYLGSTQSNLKSQLIDFIFSAAQTALLETTALGMRIWKADSLITRPTIATTVTNGAFGSAIGTGWIDSSDTNATSASAGGVCTLTGNDYAAARITNTVTVAGGDIAKIHGLRITVTRGPVTLRIGTTSGGDELIKETALGTGTHSIGFTPGATTFYIRLEAEGTLVRKLTSCSIEAAGNVSVPTPWAGADLDFLRWAQSADVIFTACRGYKPVQIERRNWDSWSVIDYQTTDGPYRAPNIRRINLSPSARTGSVTLTATKAVFYAGHVGALFKLTHLGQLQQKLLQGESQFTDPIRVVGVGQADRQFTIDIANLTGTGSTVTLQRSYGDVGDWTDYLSYTANQSAVAVNDSPGSGAATGEINDNQIIFYRLAIKPGNYSTGTATCKLTYGGGIQTGICRVTAYSSPTSVTAEVLTPFASTQSTDDWVEGEWSDYRGWPSSVKFFDGRLWWAGFDKVYGSVSDDFNNFSPEVEGDSGPIIRSIATGPVEGINWILPLQRLLVGTASSEVSIRSSSFDEPLTPTNFTARDASTRGCADVNAIKIDASGLFIQGNGNKMFELTYSLEANDYASSEVTRINRDILLAGVTRLTSQRQPDTRIWSIKADGEAAILLYEKNEQVVGWSRYITDGDIESAACLRGVTADYVYLQVLRTIGGSPVRYIEKVSLDSEAVGANDNWMADCAIKITQAASTTVSGLGHLEGKGVIVWDNGRAVVDQSGVLPVVTGGQITGLPVTVTTPIIGLPYTGKIKTVKLAYASQGGTALAQKKKVDHLAMIASNICLDGIKLGPSFDKLTRFSGLYQGKTLAVGQVLPSYDADASSFGGSWDTDSRVCLQMQAPYPATIGALIVGMLTNG